MTFSVDFPLNSPCEKLAEKVANNSYMAMGHYNCFKLPGAEIMII